MVNKILIHSFSGLVKQITGGAALMVDGVPLIAFMTAALVAALLVLTDL